MPQVPTDKLRNYAEALFVASGSPEDIASHLVNSLLLADQSGHPSHGIIRVPRYLEYVAQGRIVPNARPEVLKRLPSAALVDGCLGFGQATASFTTQIAIDLATDNGISIAGAIRCNHAGRVGQWAEMAADQGMIFIGFVGGPTGFSGTPFGGAGRALCTNPIAAAVPGNEHEPMIMDFATTTTAEGKIQVARAKGSQLPSGQVLDKRGNPTTDPEEFYDGGMLLPFGGHKGYALSLLVEAMASCLTGAGDSDEYAKLGFTAVVINPGVFVSEDQYRASADSLFARMEAIPPAPNYSEVMIPGAPEHRSRALHDGRGIELADTTIRNLRDEGERLQVDTSLLD